LADRRTVKAKPFSPWTLPVPARQVLITELKQGRLNLDDPAVTLELLRLNAVVGLTGFSDSQGKLRSVGIQCALCHSIVDNAVASGIGHRLDGWANRDLNVGAIINLAPDLGAIATLLGVSQTAVRTVLAAWGPGKFDAELLLDGKGFRPDGKSAATLIPPAFGLAGVNLHTWTGLGVGHPLECVCGKPGDARQRNVLRSTPGRSRSVSGGGSQWLRRCAQ
jgi:hypothetical protein